MCVFWKESSVYAKEVDYNTTVKVSLTWEISSKDIAGCKIEDNNDLLHALGYMLVSKIQVEAFINFEEIRNDERLTERFSERFSERSIEEAIAEIKQFMEDYPDGLKESYFKDKSEETITDGFPIKVEMIFEKDQENWMNTIENWDREYKLEPTNLFNRIKTEYEQFNIEVNGEAVDVSELMSIVNEYHQSLDDWTCEFPLVDYMSAA